MYIVNCIPSINLISIDYASISAGNLHECKFFAIKKFNRFCKLQIVKTNPLLDKDEKLVRKIKEKKNCIRKKEKRKIIKFQKWKRNKTQSKKESIFSSK